MARVCRALIDLRAIGANLRIARDLAPSSKTLAVVKADAYGHGALRVCGALTDADAFGVASIEEALELRGGGIRHPILLLQGVFEESELAKASQCNFWVVVHCQEQLELLRTADMRTPMTVWLKADTGLHRLGFAPHKFSAALDELRASAVVGDIVLWTHFANSDETGNPFTDHQMELFRQLTATSDLPISLAASAALLTWPESHGDWNRPGYMLYGNSPLPAGVEASTRLVPAMTLEAKVTALRTVSDGETVGYGRTWKAHGRARIATVSAGYGDGYPRHAPNGTPVLVNDHRVPLAGRVSMDMLAVDVTALDQVTVGDPVTLWGPALPVDEIASRASTIGYELLTGLTRRVTKQYIGS